MELERSMGDIGISVGVGERLLCGRPHVWRTEPGVSLTSALCSSLLRLHVTIAIARLGNTSFWLCHRYHT
jgi:hypothetical protein